MKITQMLCAFILFASLAAFSEEAEKNTSAATAKKTVCLNMIVKNEKDVITRCLKSVLPFIDYWVIVDTGSNDGTQQIIRDFMDKNKIPGELHERPWVNFGYNREQALDLARDKADYLMFIDADDEVTYPSDFKLPDLIYDLYLVDSHAKWTKYQIIFLAKANQEMHWRDPVHEFLDAKDAKVAGHLVRVQYIYHHDGARSKDQNTLKKDIQLLLECYAKDPTYSRTLFFLGQTYRALEENELALKYFKERIALGGEQKEEVFWSMLQVAHIERELNYDTAIVIANYERASDYLPRRLEPVLYLAEIARLNGDYQKGYDTARSGINVSPPDDSFYVESAACDAIIYEFADCAFHLEKYDECIKACNKILKRNHLPDDYLLETRKLRESALDQKRLRGVLRSLEKLQH